MITSLIGEAKAIGWYEQRTGVEKNEEAKSIMQDKQKEEMKHFGIDLEGFAAQQTRGERF